MNRSGSRGAACGFTLIEVLIATTLLAVMMLLLIGSLRIGAQSWDTGEQHIAEASRMFIVESFLHSHIASLLPVAGTTTAGQSALAFRGARDGLEYVAPMPAQLETGGLFRFELYLGKHGEHRDLRLAIHPYLVVSQSGSEPELVDDLALLEDVKEVKFSYLPMPVPGRAPQWLEEWQQHQLPALIRMDIEPEGGTPWPPIVVAPRTHSLR